MEAFDQIDTFCEGSGIPKAVIDMAKYFYKEAHGGGLFRHRFSTHTAMVAGCIFVACRQCELPRSFQEISKLTNVSKSDIGKIFKLLDMFFSSQAYFKVEDEGEDSAETAYGSFPPVDQYWVVKMLTPWYIEYQYPYKIGTKTHAKDLCDRWCSQLGLEHKCHQLSQELAHRVEDDGTSRSPVSVAAACIFTTCRLMGQDVTRHSISEVSCAHELTISNACKDIYHGRERLMDSAWLQKNGLDIGQLNWLVDEQTACGALSFWHFSSKGCLFETDFGLRSSSVGGNGYEILMCW